MRLSKHAKKRMKQRCGLHGKSAVRIGERVFESGLRREDTKGRLAKWLDLVGKYNQGKLLIVHGETCYIFSSDNVLITLLNIPPELTKDMKKMVNRNNY